MTFVDSIPEFRIFPSAVQLSNRLRNMLNSDVVIASNINDNTATRFLREFGTVFRQGMTEGVVVRDVTLYTLAFGELSDEVAYRNLGATDILRLVHEFSGGALLGRVEPPTRDGSSTSDEYCHLRLTWANPRIQESLEYESGNRRTGWSLRAERSGDVDSPRFSSDGFRDMMSSMKEMFERRVSIERARRREAASVQTHKHARTPSRSGGGDFSAFLRGQLGQFQDALEDSGYSLDSLEQIQILPHGTLSSRRWGIEIEAVDIEGIDTPNNWNLEHDGSLSGVYVGGSSGGNHDYECASYDSGDEDDCDGYDDCQNEGYTKCGEWTSPILRSIHSRGLEALCGNLEGRQSNDTPGVHVHVESSDLTAMQAARVSLFYTMVEPLIEAEYQREARNYCRQISAVDAAERMRAAREFMVNRPKESVTRFSSGDRYTTVNLQALGSHGTIEFRAMGPVYEYEHLIRWATFCREIVNLAASRVSQERVAKVRSMSDLLELFVAYGQETPNAEATKPVLGYITATGDMETRAQRGIDSGWDVFDDFDYVRESVLA